VANGTLLTSRILRRRGQSRNERLKHWWKDTAVKPHHVSPSAVAPYPDKPSRLTWRTAGTLRRPRMHPSICGASLLFDALLRRISRSIPHTGVERLRSIIRGSVRCAPVRNHRAPSTVDSRQRARARVAQGAAGSQVDSAQGLLPNRGSFWTKPTVARPRWWPCAKWWHPSTARKERKD
jgi:hypothetical protein